MIGVRAFGSVAPDSARSIPAVTRRLPAGERRAQLIAAALEIAETEGLGAVTIRGVADRAGVSLGVVHYCFTDKEELIGEVIGAVNDEVHDAAKASLDIDLGGGDPGPEGLRRRLSEAIDLIWSVISAAPERQLLTYEIVCYSLRAHGIPEIGLAGGQKVANELIVRRVLESASDGSGMRWRQGIDELTALALAIIDGVGLRWQIDRDETACRRLLHVGVDLLTESAVPAR